MGFLEEESDQEITIADEWVLLMFLHIILYIYSFRAEESSKF